MMASSWALRLIVLVSCRSFVVGKAVCNVGWLTTGAPSSPVVPDRSLLRHDFVEVRVFANQHFPENVILTYLNRLQPDQFKQRQEHADQCLTRWYIAQHLLQTDRARFDCEAAMKVLNHLSDCHGFFIHFQYRAVAGAVENLLECFYEIDDVSGQFGLGAFSLHELFERWIAQDRIF